MGELLSVREEHPVKIILRPIEVDIQEKRVSYILSVPNWLGARGFSLYVVTSSFVLTCFTM